MYLILGEIYDKDIQNNLEILTKIYNIYILSR